VTARLPTTIVCKYCLEEPEACDCESCGNDSARLIEFAHAIARRDRARRPPTSARECGPESLPQLHRTDVA